MKSFRIFLWVVLSGVGLSGCNSGDEPALYDKGYSYFPLKKGLYHIYDVERTTYVLGNPGTVIYQLKTLVVDSFLNAENGYTYVIHRSVRDTEQDEWQYVDSWSIRSSARETLVQIQNLPVLNLKYPVRKGLEWDCNVYNTLDKNEFRIEDIQASKTYGDVVFDDCLSITQEDNDDYVVFLDQRHEVYARNIGLVYKDSTALQYCSQPDCIGQEVVNQGVIYKQTIRAYGVE